MTYTQQALKPTHHWGSEDESSDAPFDLIHIHDDLPMQPDAQTQLEYTTQGPQPKSPPRKLTKGYLKTPSPKHPQQKVDVLLDLASVNLLDMLLDVVLFTFLDVLFDAASVAFLDVLVDVVLVALLDVLFDAASVALLDVLLDVVLVALLDLPLDVVLVALLDLLLDVVLVAL